MTLKVRDEEDVLDTNLRYHLAQGVDFFVVTDNGSRDATPEILERYASAGRAHVIRQPSDDFKRLGREWVTRMARLAASEFEADWVLHADADEFWWPVSGTLSAAFADIPERFGLLTAPRPEFVARPDGPGSFVERLIHREARSRLQHKVAHRADAEASVGRGAHKVELGGRDGPGARGAAHAGRAVLRTVSPSGPDRPRRLVPAPQWPIRILHFPVRSYEQYRRRIEVTLFHGGYDARGRRRELLRHYEEGRLPDLYRQLVLDDAAVAAGVAEGTLVRDVGLRDFVAGCPDPISGEGGVAAARTWAASARRLSAEERAAELAANHEDMMATLDRADRSIRRQRRQANRRVARLKQERTELKRMLREAERDRDRANAQADALRSTPWHRARALVARALRRS